MAAEGLKVADSMKKTGADSDMLDEYDFNGGVTGKYAKRYAKGSNGGGDNVLPLKIIIEKHPDGYVAYPLGLKGVVVGEGDSYDEALADVKSAIAFHLETFGDEALNDESPVLEAFITEAGATV